MTITIEDEMKRSYLDYAMSVIVSRALPDVRDGLKPVHRRILFSMKEQGYDWNRTYHKSARVVGDVMGKYHPHGDSAIYDAMVRMAQTFSMRLPLIDGQGNFGSMDGDPAAAMRYTEVRLAKSAHELLEDIDKDTVDFQENYDNSSREPTVLPARYPNLLVNGASGIAVGMATNIPPHNLGEVIDACCLLLNDPETSIDQLMECVPGPDFPTGGIIYGSAGIHSALHSGRGSVIMRGRTEIESLGRDREAIIVSEIPYQVNKSRMMEQIAEVVRDKKVEGISDLRDESDRHGVRVVIELKRDAMHELVLNQLFRFTQLQTSFGVNMLALRAGRPEMMNLRDILTAFIEFREQVITRRTIFHLSKARDRAHILVGLAISVANLDDIIALVRAAKDPQAARENLMTKPWPAKDVAPLIELIDEPGRAVIDGNYQLSEAQARAILELRLHRLTGLERDKIATELHEVCAEISQFLGILASREKLRGMLRDEVLKVKEEFATPRRTELVESEAEVDIEDLIQREDMVVTVSHNGYIKRVPLKVYRAQRRGGKGRAGMSTREEDFVAQVFVVNTHTPVLFFSSRGIVYKEKVYRLPLGTPQARGKAFVNLLPLADGEVITTLMPLPEDEDGWGDLHVMFATASGNVRRNRLSDFTNVMANGKIAMKLDQGDRLIGVQTCSEDEDALLATRGGKCIRFPVTGVRVFSGRNSTGNRGIRLGEGDAVMSMSILGHTEIDAVERAAYLRQANAARRGADEEGEGEDGAEAEEGAENGAEVLSAERFAALEADEQFLLTIADSGFGKRSSAYGYRVTRRGGKGIELMKLDTAEGLVAAAFTVEADDQIMLVTDGGKLIRTPVADIRVAGRSTRGVTLFRIAKDERVVSVAHLIDVGEEEGNFEETGADDAPAQDLAQDNGSGGANGEDDSPALDNGDGEGKDHG
ncbi:MAG: DNA gyrase subunit A [Alphaproteobacteria bacterium]|nr:DNA gyrase subunit A [Alphaproteobacteria bacterium]